MGFRKSVRPAALGYPKMIIKSNVLFVTSTFTTIPRILANVNEAKSLAIE
jgi:hypothetical protein